MRTKKVNRYYCDFCKRSGCSAGHMRKHEERCTANPHRKCGVCIELLGHIQPSMESLLAAAWPWKGMNFHEYGWCDSEQAERAKVEQAMFSAISDAADECPACMLAALRQSGIYDTGQIWTYKQAMDDLWADVNASGRGQ